MLSQIITDVAGARRSLDLLQADPNIAPDQIACCVAAVQNLATILEDVLTVPWVPNQAADIQASIFAMTESIRNMERLIGERIDEVWNAHKPDEMLRVDCALTALEILKYQRDVLMMRALMKAAQTARTLANLL